MSEHARQRTKITNPVFSSGVLFVILFLLLGFGKVHAAPCTTTTEALPWLYNGHCYATQAEAEAVLRGIVDANGDAEDHQDWRIHYELKSSVDNNYLYHLPPKPHLPSPAWRTRSLTHWAGWGWRGPYSPYFATDTDAMDWLAPQHVESLIYRGNRFVAQGPHNLEHKYYSHAYTSLSVSVIDFDAFDFRYCGDFTAGVEDAKISGTSHSIYLTDPTPSPSVLHAGVNNCEVNDVWYGIKMMPVFDIYQIPVPVCQTPYISDGTQCVSGDEDFIFFGGAFALSSDVQPMDCPKSDDSNPCNPSDGSKSQVEVDITMPGQGGLTFARYYNSKGTHKTDEGFATGWRHTFSRQLDEVPDQRATLSFAVAPTDQSDFYYTAAEACTSGWNDIKATVWAGDLSNATSTFKGGNTCRIEENGNVVAYFPVRKAGGPMAFTQAADIKTVSRPNGAVITFEHDGTAWVNYLNPALKLEQVGSDFVYTDANDTKETYNAAGNIVSIETREGLVTTIDYGRQSYGPNKPEKVTGPHGHHINLYYNYPMGQLWQVSSPGGGVIRYEYAGGRLSRTTHDTIDGGRDYLYEDPDLPDHLTGIVDRNGDRFATWAYDDSGRAVLSEHAGGKEQVQYAYNMDGSTTLTMGNGATRTYNFETVEGQRRLTSVSGDVCGTCPGGNTASKTYDANGFLDEVTDWNGNVTQTIRNSRGLVETRIEAKGTAEERTTTTSWHPTFRLPTQIVSPKNTTNMAYDANGNMASLSITDGADSRTWTFTYNATGQPLTIDGPRTDVSDVTTLTYYNCTTGYYCGQVATSTNALGQVTNYTGYTGDGRLSKMIDANGLETIFHQNALSQITRVEQEPTSGADRATTYTYDDLKRVSTVETSDGMILTYTYDAAHYLRSITDNLGNRIDYDYDTMGNLKDEDTYDPGNNLKRAMDYVYDINQRIDTVSSGGFVTDFTTDLVGNLTNELDPALASTQHSYDALNRLTQSIDALSGVIDYAYDDHDNLTSVTAANGASTSYVYDNLDNLTQEVSPDRGTVTYTYDAAGNSISKLDARGKLTTYAYDALNRLTLVTLDGGNTIAYEYDTGTNAKGRLNKITDASGQTTWAYNNFGEVTAKTQTIGTVALTTSYSYDTSGRLSSMTLPSGKLVTYGYNSYQQDSVSVDGTAVLSGATYDPFGPVNGWTWGSGNINSRDYDLRGLTSSQVIADSTRALGYDNAGRLIDVVDQRFDQDVGYDLLGRLTSFAATDVSVPPTGMRWLALAAVGSPDTTYLDSVTISGSGDFVWSPTVPTTAGDYEIRLFDPGSFTRIATSDTITVSAAQPLPSHIALSATDVAAGGTLTATLTNASGYQWDWLALYRVPGSYVQWSYVGTEPTFIWQITAPTTLGDYQVRLNSSTAPASSPVFTVSATGSSVVLPVDLNTTLVATGGTVTATVAEAATAPTTMPPPVLPLQVFTYDANGNRAAINEDATSYPYTNQSSSNRLLSTAGPTAKTYTFDTSGNVTGDGVHSYAYDDRGRLVDVDLGTTIYEHNGQGQRVRKDNGTVSLFAYDEAGNLIGEYDSTGNAVQEHVWFNGAPVAVLRGNDMHYVHTDHLGTPRAISDSGRVIWRWESDPFGATAAQDDPDGDTDPFTYNLRFPGQYYDVETGLHYNYFRTYDPSTGRYLESDPIGLGGGANTYGYVEGSPTTMTDPYGLCGWACLFEPTIMTLGARPVPLVTPRPLPTNPVGQAVKTAVEQAQKPPGPIPLGRSGSRRIDQVLDKAGAPRQLRPEDMVPYIEHCPAPRIGSGNRPDSLNFWNNFLEGIAWAAKNLNSTPVPATTTNQLWNPQTTNPAGADSESTGYTMEDCRQDPWCT